MHHLLTLLVSAGLIVASTPAFGFHKGGVASCGSCHIMHNSEDGTPVDPNSSSDNKHLLRAGTPSDVCLSCHGGSISDTFSRDPLNPPAEIGSGNFAFLLEDNLNDGPGGADNPISGDAAGHNILAPARGVGPDGTLPRSPGGSFPSQVLGCTSCHDPHGNGEFRMLHGAGPVQQGIYTFEHPAFSAEGLPTLDEQERRDRHTAYKSGVSAWCANCHEEFHDGGEFRHPSDVEMGADIASFYNLYNGSGDPHGGTQATAYLPEVPFEDPTAEYTSTAGPSATSKVMCLTCHRAHASSAPDAGRWDFGLTFLAEDGVESGSHAIPNPYGIQSQRSLCNKCHVKDE